jgi:hypothetical protein
VLPHLQKRVVQIRDKFLPDSEDGLTVLTKRLGERVDSCDESRALRGQVRVLPEKIVEHVDDEKRHSGHNRSGGKL